MIFSTSYRGDRKALFSLCEDVSRLMKEVWLMSRRVVMRRLVAPCILKQPVFNFIWKNLQYKKFVSTLLRFFFFSNRSVLFNVSKISKESVLFKKGFLNCYVIRNKWEKYFLVRDTATLGKRKSTQISN